MFPPAGTEFVKWWNKSVQCNHKVGKKAQNAAFLKIQLELSTSKSLAGQKRAPYHIRDHKNPCRWPQQWMT
jgi:hypothetical protein